MNNIIAMINSKQYNIKELSIVDNIEKNVVTGEDFCTVRYAKYTVIGKNSEWVNYTQLDKFIIDNPNIELS